MKLTKIVLGAAALAFSLGAYSQKDTTIKKDTVTHRTDTTRKPTGITESETKNLQDQQSATLQQATTGTAIKKSAITDSSISKSTTSGDVANATIDSAAGASVSSGVTPVTEKPNFGRYYIPVLGSYNAVATTTNATLIKVTGDDSNPGKIWVDGLSGTKFFALLKAVPGTYKIPAQNQDGSDLAEGTLIYDEHSKLISVCTGCGYNDRAPVVIDEVVTTMSPENDKCKKRQNIEKTRRLPVIIFTGTKTDQGTVSLLQ